MTAGDEGAPDRWYAVISALVRGSSRRDEYRALRPSFVDRPDITNTAMPLRRGKTVVRKYDAI